MAVENLIGRTLGRFEVRELIGVGGMGTVYRAYQTNLKREVALKLLPPSLTQGSDYQARFDKEVEIAASLEHAHIVPIYDHGVESGISYVAMRLLTGGTLGERIQNQGKPPTVHEIGQMLRQLASALDYAHSKGIIHRDIKTNNVMFDDQGSSYLVDFGIAKLLSETNGLTSSSVMIGTPYYMSPEQWRGETVSPASDQYALAVLAYVALSGVMPFDAPTPYVLMTKHLTEMPTPLHTKRSDIPPTVTQVIDRALAKDPTGRFETVREFSGAFEEAIRELPKENTQFLTRTLPKKQFATTTPAAVQTVVEPTPAPMLPPAAPPPVSAATLENGAPAPRNPALEGKSRGRMPLFAALAALLILGIVGAFALSSGSLNSFGAGPTLVGGGRGQIAFHSFRDGETAEIYMMGMDGENETRVTVNNYNDWGPIWSPNGLTLLYVNDRDSTQEIYQTEVFVMDADGHNERRLTTNVVFDYDKAWSPDGRRVVFVSLREGNPEIYTMNATDGQDVRRLTINTDDEYQPSWSPRGDLIAFYSFRDGNAEIFTMNSFTGANQERLTSNNFDDKTPVWSPDGSMLAFVTSRDGNNEIYIMNADGTNQRRLTVNDADDDRPAWSPDGRWIVFQSNREGEQYDIYLMDINGDNLLRLTDDPANDQEPSWRP
ncbi:MAG: protein kinase [Chloroflexota bacterium]|nr:protein kinase [Chloroflexota bacterium]